jgi:hypothetical protein
MQKTAQSVRQTGRGVLNKLREMTNVSGVAAEKFFSPQFEEVMNSLREIDNDIRSIVVGKPIEGGNPDPSNMGDARSLKDILKSAKSNFSRREYMTAVAELARFHQKMSDVVKNISQLDGKVNEIHHKFLFQDLDEDHKKQLENLKTRFAAEQYALLIKEASVMDFLYSVVNKRGRALAFYEKRYPKEVGKLKKDTSNLLSKSDSLLGVLLTSLKEMASARATRNIDAYIRSAGRISNVYGNYNNIFKEYYTTNIKGFLDKVSPPPPTEKVEDQSLGKTNIPTTPAKEVPELDTPINNPPAPAGPAANVTPTSIPPAPDTERNLTPPVGMTPNSGVTNVLTQNNPPRRTMVNVPPVSPDEEVTQVYPLSQAHVQFFESLMALGNEHPLIISNYIQKYAQSIQGSDPITAIKLWQISKSVRG